MITQEEILAPDAENTTHWSSGGLSPKRMHQYDVALRQIYDELFELNVTKNTYRMIYHRTNKYSTLAKSGCLTESITLLAANMIFSEDRPHFLAFMAIEHARQSFSSGTESLIGEFRRLWMDGIYRWTSITLFPLNQANQANDEVYLGFVMDIDAQKRALEFAQQKAILLRNRDEGERCRVIVEQTETIVVDWKRAGNQYYIDPKISELLEGDYSATGPVQVWQDQNMIHPDDLPVLYRFLQSPCDGSNKSAMTIRVKTRKNSFCWFRVVTSYVRDENAVIQRTISTINDVDEAIRSELTLKYRAEFDTLTGIYNMDTFCTKAQHCLRTYTTEKYAVIRMDINRFKFINDIYGLEEGDKLLCYIAQQIGTLTPDHGAYGRLGSDIFCILAPYQQQKQLISLIQKLTDLLANYGLGYRVIPSFGICMVDDRLVPISILCDWANLALKTVKGNMIRKWAFYDNKLRARQLEERIIEDEMDNALLQKQFSVYLQPKHNISSQAVVGAEALVRWNHPQEGLLLPGRFIPLFERNGFIVRLDEFVWEETFRILRRWIEKGWKAFPVSVNVSRAHIYNPLFGEKLLSLLKKYDIPSNLIELELTESTFIENPGEIYSTMKMLQETGFSFSMDDFGSGYSSLNMLKNAPINTIKLDREFLNETTATPKGQTVIQCTVSMANQLNLKVIAEGVETSAQAAFLLQVGCSVAQGFYFSHPMPIEQFEQLAFPNTTSGGQ